MVPCGRQPSPLKHEDTALIKTHFPGKHLPNILSETRRTYLSELTYDLILSLPKDQAERRMNRLALADQISLVLLAPWEKRQEIIILSENARQVVRALPVEELFWTIKAVGPRDATHILRLASAEQLQFIFDLDWWLKAELRPDKIAAWLLILFETGEEVVSGWCAWISRRDEYLLPSLLRPFVHVVKRPDEMDVQEAKDLLPGFTLDDTYFFQFKNEKLQPLIARLLMKILDLSPGLYRDTMESILWETRTADLEGAQRLRKGRLNDRGVPDYYDSLDIYAPVPGGRVRSVKGYPRASTSMDEEMPAFVPTLYMGTYPCLRKAIEELSGALKMERVVLEWIGASNKIIMADLVDMDDPDALKGALTKAASLCNLGLELLCSDGMGGPADILGSTVVEDIIRTGNQAIKKVVAMAEAIFPDKGTIGMMPEPTSLLIQGLFLERAMYWDNRQGRFRPFSSLEELRNCQRGLADAAILKEIMENIVPGWRSWEDSLDWKNTNFLTHGEFTWLHGLTTAIANSLLGKDLTVHSIDQKALPHLKEILEKHFAFGGRNSNDVCRSPEALKFLERAVEKLTTALPSQRRQDAFRQKLLEALSFLYEELHSLPDTEEIDGRFISSCLVEVPKGIPK